MSCNCANCKEPMPEPVFPGVEENTRRRLAYEGRTCRDPAQVKGAGIPKYDPTQGRK